MAKKVRPAFLNLGPGKIRSGEIKEALRKESAYSIRTLGMSSLHRRRIYGRNLNLKAKTKFSLATTGGTI